MQTRLAIVLDPGHGGHEPGHVQPDGDCPPTFVEADYVLEIADAVRLELARTHWPIDVCMTRWRDETVSHAERYVIAQAAAKRVGGRGRSFVLSIHVDSSPDPRSRGPRVYRMPTAGYGAVFAAGFNNTHGREKVGVINGQPVGDHRPCRIVRPLPHWTGRAHHVMRRHDDGALVECGYATNADDLAWLESDEGRARLVTALKIGLRDVVQIVNPHIAF